MRKFFVSYQIDKEELKNDTIVLYEEGCENAKEGNLALMILKKIIEIESSGLFYKKKIVLINFWEIYDKTN